MVIEESSVVAAAANAANFWCHRGGVTTRIIDTQKVGQVHFLYRGKKEKLFRFFQVLKPSLLRKLTIFEASMKNRGGGILGLDLKDLTQEENGLYQLFFTFNTCDAMGANFINSILEFSAQEMTLQAPVYPEFSEGEDIQVIMSILSNYTPDCRVKATISCPIEDLGDHKLGMEPELFAQKFALAVRISQVDLYRATTHNKGIMNGIDAVVLATGNDFRAVESSVHAFAGRSGKYRGLTEISLEKGHFSYHLEIPLALGTVGGLTSLHPLAKISLEMMGNPSARELMELSAAVGLLQNFSAIRSLVTSGIQKGHMKMHLLNILNHLAATFDEREKAKEYFRDKVISFSAVKNFIDSIRILQ
jgi:hydroxymethylglutaryl-CoA reductase